MQELNQAEDIKQLTEKVKEQNVYFSLLKINILMIVFVWKKIVNFLTSDF